MTLKLNLFLIIALFGCAQSATFDISSVSECRQQSSQGFCTKWVQNGSVQETTGCFPIDTQVLILKNGTTIAQKIQNLQVGDKILGNQDGKQEFYEVIGWLHINSTMELQYLNVITQSGFFRTTPMHNMALMDGSYTFAQNLEGEFLYNGQKVIKIEKQNKIGAFAPLTKSGNFYVKINQNSKTLAHCYAHISNPEFYQPFVNIIFNVWQTIYGQPQSAYEVHPAIQWMMSKFDFLLIWQ